MAVWTLLATACAEYHRRLDSAQVWQTFAPVLPESLPDMHHNTVEEPEPTLEPYIRHLRSPSPSWITSLTIHDHRYSDVELMSLTSLRNLVHLCIQSTDHRTCSVSNTLIRGWSHQATQSGAFPYLSTLLLRGQREVSCKSFRELNAFPELRIVVLYECRLDETNIGHVRKWGWLENDR